MRCSMTCDNGWRKCPNEDSADGGERRVAAGLLHDLELLVLEGLHARQAQLACPPGIGVTLDRPAARAEGQVDAQHRGPHREI